MQGLFFKPCTVKLIRSLTIWLRFHISALCHSVTTKKGWWWWWQRPLGCFGLTFASVTACSILAGDISIVSQVVVWETLWCVNILSVLTPCTSTTVYQDCRNFNDINGCFIQPSGAPGRCSVCLGLCLFVCQTEEGHVPPSFHPSVWTPLCCESV